VAWPTRSTLLAVWRQATTANTKYYAAAVASGHKWLVKNITFYNGSAATTTFYIWLKSGGVEYPVDQTPALAVEGVFNHIGLALVLEPGDQLGFSTTANKTLVAVTAHGALLG
jgi:hypothetical protein